LFIRMKRHAYMSPISKCALIASQLNATYARRGNMYATYM